MPLFLKAILGFIIDRVLKFAWEKVSAFIKRDKEKKETNEQIAKEEAAKLAKLKSAQTKEEIEDAAKDSISKL